MEVVLLDSFSCPGICVGVQERLTSTNTVQPIIELGAPSSSQLLESLYVEVSEVSDGVVSDGVRAPGCSANQCCFWLPELDPHEQLPCSDNST